MPRQTRRPSKRTHYKRRKQPKFDLQKWLLNVVIFCLAIVVVGFIFSMGKRFSDAPAKVQLSQVSSMPSAPATARFQPIVVEVLNGCGTSGIAQQFTNYLRQEGFDVIYTGNADHQNYNATIMIEHTDQNKMAGLNAVLLLEAGRLYTKIDSSVQADVTLIIGKDYAQLPVYRRIQEIKENF